MRRRKGFFVDAGVGEEAGEAEAGAHGQSPADTGNDGSAAGDELGYHDDEQGRWEVDAWAQAEGAQEGLSVRRLPAAAAVSPVVATRTASRALARLVVLDIARSQLGVMEYPPGSNWGPEVREYLRAAGWTRPAPWCMAFVHWCFEQVGMQLGGGASVGFFEAWARERGELVERPFRGDVVCYRFDADDWADHVGIVERVLTVSWRGRVFTGVIATIEGNTGIGNDANGGKVMRRRRRVNRCRFVRIEGYAPPADRAV